MLDSDLAELYRVETKRINEAVTRNKEKFPERYTWKIDDAEAKSFLVAICDQKKLETRGGRFKNPRVFTEQGVAMLATILKSKQAIQISIQIMDTFVMMRKYISTNMLEQKYITGLVLKHEYDINLLQKTFSKFEEKKRVNEIYFEGQIYDAYSKLVDIFKEAKKKLIIIDSYADKTVLDMIANIAVPTTLITKKNGSLKKLDLEKYHSQYDNLNLIYDDTFHDRYIIIDDKKVYHCGASINHAGSRTFSINVLEDKEVIEPLLSKIQKMKKENKGWL